VLVRHVSLSLSHSSVVFYLLYSTIVELKWADGKLVKDEVDQQIAQVLGPRTAEDQVCVDDSKHCIA
jgi:hypothetical protein